ncbi:AraC family transcriptional regulator [bacterium]|nr:AraC family transcriptional regulator [bacterium]
MNYHIRVEQHVGRPLAVVRRVAAPAQLSKVVPEACGIVWNVIRSQNVPGAGRHVAVYYDDVIHLEVGVELETPFVGYGDVVGSMTPAGTVVTTTHLGPYGGLHHAHAAVHQWCQQQGRQLAGPRWEIYGHWLPEWNVDPSLIVTDVFYLLTNP